MFSNEEDDDFGASGGSSKLASLFDLNRSQDGNQSLMYNAPKQPKKSKKSSSDVNQTSPTMSVIYAVAVHAYKFENGTHISQGRLGAAILGNNESKAYKLLLYKGQQQHVTVAIVTVKFNFIIQANNYASFYDNHTVNWSINFENETAISMFAKHVCFAKANSCTSSLESVIFQDLVLGTGEAVGIDDSVEIKYSVNLFDCKIGELVESNLTSEKSLKVKINQGTQIKGLEDALVGMRKNGKRIAIIPPSFGYGKRKTENSALKINNLIYEVNVVKVKFNKEIESRSPTPSFNEMEKDVIARHHSISTNDEISVRARGASISEQLSQSPDRKKATIISRIVKMGQPMIPLQGAVVAQTSDSEIEDDPVNPHIGSPEASEGEASNASEFGKPVPKPRPHHSPLPTLQHQPSNYQISQPISVFQPPVNYPVPYQQISTSQFGIYGQPGFPVQSVPVPSQVVLSSENQLMLSENRGHLVEMRLQMNKIGDKLDTVVSKLDQPSQLSIHTIGSVDTAQLSYNIQKLISENERLKAENSDKNKKIEYQNEKISDLLQKNHKFIEQNHELLEHQANAFQVNSAQTQTRISTLEAEKVKCMEDCQVATIKLNSTETSLKQSEQLVRDLKQELESLKVKMETHDSIIENLQITIKTLQSQRDELESELAATNAIKNEKEKDMEKFKEQLIEECTNAEKWESLKVKYDESVAKLNDELQQAKAKHVETKTPESHNLVSEVKRVMNGVYRKLQGEFDPDFEYAGRDVCNVIKDTVLTVTLKLMEKFDAATSSTLGESSPKTMYIGQDNDDVDNCDTLSQPSPDSKSDKITQDKSEKEPSKSAATEDWKPEPPPPPYISVDDEDDEEDDWLK